MRPCRKSAAAPTNAPNSAMGRTRSIVITVTRSAEPVSDRRRRRRQHLDPAHAELDRADQPQPPEIGLGRPAARPRRIRIRQFSRSRTAADVCGPLGHVPKKWAPVVRKDRRRRKCLACIPSKRDARGWSGGLYDGCRCAAWATAGRPARNRRAARRLRPRAAVRSRPRNADRPQTRRGMAGPASGSRHAHRSAA